MTSEILRNKDLNQSQEYLNLFFGDSIWKNLDAMDSFVNYYKKNSKVW